MNAATAARVSLALQRLQHGTSRSAAGTLSSSSSRRSSSILDAHGSRMPHTSQPAQLTAVMRTSGTGRAPALNSSSPWNWPRLLQIYQSPRGRGRLDGRALGQSSRVGGGTAGRWGGPPPPVADCRCHYAPPSTAPALPAHSPSAGHPSSAPPRVVHQNASGERSIVFPVGLEVAGARVSLLALPHHRAVQVRHLHSGGRWAGRGFRGSAPGPQGRRKQAAWLVRVQAAVCQLASAHPYAFPAATTAAAPPLPTTHTASSQGQPLLTTLNHHPQPRRTSMTGGLVAIGKGRSWPLRSL